MSTDLNANLWSVCKAGGFLLKCCKVFGAVLHLIKWDTTSPLLSCPRLNSDTCAVLVSFISSVGFEERGQYSALRPSLRRFTCVCAEAVFLLSSAVSAVCWLLEQFCEL